MRVGYGVIGRDQGVWGEWEGHEAGVWCGGCIRLGQDRSAEEHSHGIAGVF